MPQKPGFSKEEIAKGVKKRNRETAPREKSVVERLRDKLAGPLKHLPLKKVD
jgi:hypothetical protein